MKNLFKYLIPLFFATFFFGGSGQLETADYSKLEFPSENVLQDSFISSPDSDLCLSHQASITNAFSPQNSARRINSFLRHNFVIIKAGKIINTGTWFFVQNQSSIKSSYFAEPAHKLAFLGKLII